MKEATLNNVPDFSKIPYEPEMNNTGIDLAIWKRLRKKWIDLEKAGHTLKIDFHLLTDVDDRENILAIDVTQYVDENVFTETIQRNASEADETLGIAGLSKERLIEVYKGMMHQLHHQTKQKDADLIVSMSPTSPTSGEVRGYVQKSNSDVKTSVLVNYQHYYMLNVLREKMIQDGEEGWSKVKAVYRSGNLKFNFEY